MRSLLAGVLLLLLVAPLVGLAAPTRRASRSTPAAQFSRSVRPTLSRCCSACHNATAKKGGLDLASMRTAAAVAREPETWERVIRKLRSGEMPPPGLPRPPAGEVKTVTAWIEGELRRVAIRKPADPGHVTARRLNRAEYNNTVRDLLGVDLQPADDFPQDDSGYGFDNIGAVLSVSPVLMEKYLAAAERVARAALFGPEPLKPSVTQLRPPGRPIRTSPEVPKEYDPSGLTLPNALHTSHRFPVEGDYDFRVVLGGERPAASEAMQLGLWVDGRLVREFRYDPEGTASFAVDRQDLAGQSTVVRTRVPAGARAVAVTLLRMYEGLPPAYGGPNPSKRPPPPPPDPERALRFLQPPPNATPEQLEELRLRRERILRRIRERAQEKAPANGARVSFMEVQGPYDPPQSPSPEARRKVYTCGHLDGRHQPGCERKILGELARRAFRRPVSRPEVERYVKLASMARAQGDSFEEGLCVALQAILVSPHFLFRIERRPASPTPQPLAPHELASRLSYFLWSSMPDEELLRLAERRTLTQPAVLEAQVRRMLRDPKSRALVENFGGQWLELRKLEGAKPDRQKFPEWDEYLRLSMRQETERFFEHVIREDRPLLDFIDADYTFLNERLARFYGIPGITGPEMRKVKLAGTQRGGVLTQASVLTISSYATRTSPVIRGRWILENLLDAAPPPPPPDVPNLDEAKIGESATLRQQLEAHRANPTCASCHARMDSLGFALENFDAVGAWREKDGQLPIDASASLPDGRSLKGPAELIAVLKADRDAFAACLAGKLLTYALGRGLERYDRPVVERIARRLPSQKYRFSALVLEIVKSAPFRMRRGDPPK